MIKKSKRIRCLIAMTCAVIIASSTLAGCGKKAATATNTSEDLNGGAPYQLTIMLPTFTGDPVTDDSPVKQALEKYTNTKIKFNFVPNDSYPDKLNITLASGSLPDLIEADKTSSILSAVNSGAFWEIGPYLNNYPNLKKANKDVMNNLKIGGKIYQIYRSRPYGRNGITYRKDWADALGISQPKTVDDFYNMLVAFTTKDPDKNGKNDTYGMAVTKYIGPFNVTMTWFGAVNGWAADKDGKLQPDFMTTAYMDNLKFWKKMYDNKLINQDFAATDSAKWTDQVTNNKAGVIVDVTDQATKCDTAFTKADPKATGKIDVFGEVAGPDGKKRNLPTTGYSGTFFFPKVKGKTEKDLKRVLAFIDKCNDHDAQIIINNGVEGREYKAIDGGFYQTITGNTAVKQNEYNDLNQLGTNVTDDPGLNLKYTDVKKKTIEVQKDNIQYCVPNPAAPFVSQTYTTSGATLDNIIETARVKFIVGQIDEAGFKTAIANWKKSGGDAVIKEYNDQYAQTKKK